MSTHPLSNYPEELYNYEVKVDPTTESYPLIQQYQQLYSSGQIDEANTLMQNNKSLQQMVISAIDINKLGDAVLAIQEYYLSDVRETLRTLIDYKGVWDALTEYNQFDMVLYKPTTDVIYGYICIERDTPVGTNPENYQYWAKVTIKGESGTGLTMRYDYLDLDQYNKDDCVIYKNKLWACLQDCANIAPDSPENSTGAYWKVVFSLTAEDIAMSDEDDTSIKDYLDELEKRAMLKAHPVNSYYWSSDSTNPSELFGGTWVQIEDKFLFAASSQDNLTVKGDWQAETQYNVNDGVNYDGKLWKCVQACINIEPNEEDSTYWKIIHSAGETGGSRTVTLTTEQIPSHDHNVTISKTTNLKGYVSHICAQNEDLTNKQKSILVDGKIFTRRRNGVIYYGYKGRYSKGYDTFDMNVNHTHPITEKSVGGGQPHNNMPPYIVAYCWQRTA